jgi:hypothetical protein
MARCYRLSCCVGLLIAVSVPVPLDAQERGTPSGVGRKMQEPNQPLRQLTVDDIRKLLKVEAVVLQIVIEGKAGGPGSLDSPSGVAAASSALEANPEAMRVLSAVDWTGRDFWLTFLATHAAITGLLPFGTVAGSAWGPNLQLIQDLPSDIAGPLAEWKRVRFGLN